MGSAFDQYSEKYDEWFMKNGKDFLSEALLVENMLENEKGRILSVGCGSGLFEKVLRDKEIVIEDCIELSKMGRIAEKKGLKVKIGYAENLPISDESYHMTSFPTRRARLSIVKINLLLGVDNVNSITSHSSLYISNFVMRFPLY